MQIFRIIAVIVVLWPTVTGMAADPSDQVTAKKFDGYLYLDAEGQPLPIQTDDEIEAWLSRAEIIDLNWRLWFIDCSRCFGTTKTMYFPLETISQCERGLWQGLKNLNEDEIRETLSPHLDRAGIKALLARREKMVQQFQKLIDEKGEAAVLYDVDPPSEKAPWADD